MRTMSSPATSMHQRGAALVVSLVMMVILTLIGIVAMNSSSIELMMAGNMQLQTRATANAERTLATAEGVAEGLSGQTTYSEDGIYSRANQLSNLSLNVRNTTWSFTSAQADSENNRYVIEYLGVFPVDATGIKMGGGYSGSGGFSEVNVFRVTSRAEDAKGAVRMMQSIFVKAV